MHNKTLKGLWDLVPLFARWDWPARLGHLESLLFPHIGSHTRAPVIIETQSPYRSPECPPGWYRPIEIILIELTSVDICWLFIMNQSSCSCSRCSFHLVLTTVPWTRTVLERAKWLWGARSVGSRAAVMQGTYLAPTHVQECVHHRTKESRSGEGRGWWEARQIRKSPCLLPAQLSVCKTGTVSPNLLWRWLIQLLRRTFMIETYCSFHFSSSWGDLCFTVFFSLCRWSIWRVSWCTFFLVWLCISLWHKVSRGKYRQRRFGVISFSIFGKPNQIHLLW